MNIREAVVTIFEAKEKAGVDEFIVIANEDDVIFRFGKGDKVVSDSYPVHVLSRPEAEIGLEVQLTKLAHKL